MVRKNNPTQSVWNQPHLFNNPEAGSWLMAYRNNPPALTGFADSNPACLEWAMLVERNNPVGF